ncbi:hypothetical protein N7539_009462 [Penicillium diatomitis]|uniref:Uncharacterized protein n=1 Tax=Penicillium diatomitis TaxID=2819901 RepID=A0A9W9WKI6_9EURO|nr:uncharacterized protein N7539_009462 [Penicillium diatomitis]KAJ5466733.1 hypothetical protein N7539_009462 [Penicillium diatomitis]
MAGFPATVAVVSSFVQLVDCSATITCRIIDYICQAERVPEHLSRLRGQLPLFAMVLQSLQDPAVQRALTSEDGSRMDTSIAQIMSRLTDLEAMVFRLSEGSAKALEKLSSDIENDAKLMMIYATLVLSFQAVKLSLQSSME